VNLVALAQHGDEWGGGHIAGNNPAGEQRGGRIRMGHGDQKLVEVAIVAERLLRRHAHHHRLRRRGRRHRDLIGVAEIGNGLDLRLVGHQHEGIGAQGRRPGDVLMPFGLLPGDQQAGLVRFDGKEALSVGHDHRQIDQPVLDADADFIDLGARGRSRKHRASGEQRAGERAYFWFSTSTEPSDRVGPRFFQYGAAARRQPDRAAGFVVDAYQAVDDRVFPDR
jgi:hypothetical protein